MGAFCCLHDDADPTTLARCIGVVVLQPVARVFSATAKLKSKQSKQRIQVQASLSHMLEGVRFGELNFLRKTNCPTCTKNCPTCRKPVQHMQWLTAAKFPASPTVQQPQLPRAGSRMRARAASSGEGYLRGRGRHVASGASARGRTPRPCARCT